MPQAVDEAGNIWETDDQGNPLRPVGRQGGQQGGVFTLPPNPRQVQQDAMEAERLRIMRGNAARDAQTSSFNQSIALGKSQREQIEFAAKFNPDGTPKATPEQQREDRDRLSRLDQLTGQINRVQDLFNTSVGTTKGLRGFLDYLPTNENARFDTAGAALSQQGLAAFRVPGTGTVSDRDAMMFDRANLPTAATRDSAIDEQLRGLRGRVDEEMRALGRPPVDWRGNVMDQTFVTGNNPLNAAAAGATEAAGSIPPAMQEAHRKWMAANIGQPGFADAYVQFRQGMDAASGFQSDPDAYRAWAQDVEKNARGGTINADIAPPTRKLSATEQLRNSAINNPVGAAIAGIADAGGFGIPSALANDQYRALNDQQGLPMALGQIAGAIGATGAIGKGTSLGLDSLARGAPRLAARARSVDPFIKSLGADVAYSGVYGANTGQDPLTSMAMGAVGSAGGQALGGGAGLALSGIKASPTLARLRSQGVTPTIGQIMRARAADSGGRSFIAGAEDVIANTGVLNNVVNSARQRSLEDANLAAFNIGARGQGAVTDIAGDGIDQLTMIKNNVYADALNGVSLPASDPVYLRQMQAAQAAGQSVDQARSRGDFGYIMDKQVMPLMPAPNITGRQMQDVLRTTQGQQVAYNRAANSIQPDPMAGGVADALGQVNDAITGLTARHAPQAIPKLKQANAINRALMILDDATQRGRNEGGVFTGSQLGDAIAANTKKLGGRGFSGQKKSPFHQLQQDMQAVLPNKVPPTGVNAAPVLAALGALGYGTGEATDIQWLKSAGLAGLGAAAYTKKGQAALAKALLDRPEALKKIGRTIRKKKGLVGTATLPSLLADY